MTKPILEEATKIGVQVGASIVEGIRSVTGVREPKVGVNKKRTSAVWAGLVNSEMDEINALIGPSLGKSTTKAPKQTKVKSTPGVVTHFNDERGFGFIRSGSSRIFFHISELHDDVDTAFIPAGTRVTFETGKDKNGRECAVSIKVLG
ncbi:cold-shock protein [Paenibacillus xylanilyticus]|uniref:cold-shock protein n=1 Tax=Paenibacillus xylanilyticus TaxID=248903 RepID=UPI003AAD1ABA